MSLVFCSMQLALLSTACAARENVGGQSVDFDRPTAEVTTALVESSPADVPPTKPSALVIALPTATQPPLPTPVPTPATPPPTPVTPPLGSAERPIQLLFPPVSSSAVIMNRAVPLAEALHRATGAEFAIGIVDSEAALVELLCAAPTDTIGFLSAAAYTIAHDQCGGTPALVAAREDGLTWQMGMIVVRPGTAEELADLDGRTWSVADTHNLPDYLYFRALMTEEGIEPGRIVEAPEESSALLALRDGEADFTTAGFIPPIMPRDGEWIVGETEPEVWRSMGIAPSRSPIGYVIVFGEPIYGGYRIRDARARLFDTTPDIFRVTRILAVSEPIPNDTVVFGAELPAAVAEKIAATMTEFAASDACGVSLCSADLYGWTALEPADDIAYNPIRKIKNTLELEAADLWAEVD